MTTINDKNVNKNWTFVLGAQDPEMREIEKAVTQAGANFIHAAKNHIRCNPRTAYEADSVMRVGAGGIAHPLVLPPKAPAIFVECKLRSHEPILCVDHHHPG